MIPYFLYLTDVHTGAPLLVKLDQVECIVHSTSGLKPSSKVFLVGRGEEYFHVQQPVHELVCVLKEARELFG